VATSLQARVQTAARHAGLAPAPLCAAISDDLFASTQGQRYATLVYGELDTRSRTLRLVNAGHGGVQLTSADLSNPLPSTGPALGLFRDATFTSVDVELGPGTDLVIYTDGVNEALNAHDEEFGHAKVATIGQRLRGHGAAEQAAALLAEVRAHRGVRQPQDDVTVMVIRSLR
jgi:sigma-B regulation protein RsbU (phosphoserine phosphatase)